jgi:hypothetical protein
MWLGQPDPATSLLNQIHHDPDTDTLRELMHEWHAAFGTSPTTVRKAIKNANGGYPNLLDAMREFPVEDKGAIDGSKLGWLLRKNANRIVGGFEFQPAMADGRRAWRVVEVKTPPSAPLPASNPSFQETVAGWIGRI